MSDKWSRIASTHDGGVVRTSVALPPLDNDPVVAPDQRVAVPIRHTRAHTDALHELRHLELDSRRVASAPVLRSKVQPPPLRTSTLSRQRLLDKLALATQNRVTLIAADAGYGKTTLLADFSRRFDGGVIWYSLESTDADWTTLVHHFVAAARELADEFGEATLSLLRSEPGMAPQKAAVLSSFVQELQALGGERTLLVLDDLHLVDASEDVRQLLLRMIREAPRSFHFVLVGRRRPDLPLARWAGMGEVTELTTDDLRFSHEETAQLFRDSYRQKLDNDVLNELDARTRGWAACLQLFNTLISGYANDAIRAAALSLSGASVPLYDYLAQEVVAKLSPELQAFVTRASLLQSVVPAHLSALFPEVDADTVARWSAETDALGLLNRSSQVGTSRHFHPLLRDFLLGEVARRHPQEQLRRFHISVARRAESEPLTACHHYIEAGVTSEAMRALGSSTLQTIGSAKWGTAAQLAARLGNLPPTGAVAAIQARRLLEEGSLETAAAILSSVATEGEEPTVRAVLRQTRLSLCWRQGDWNSLLTTLHEILADAETPPLMREIAQVFRDSSTRAETPSTLGDLSTRLRQMADRQATMGHNYLAAISFHNASVAALYAGRGHYAIELGQRALDQFRLLGVDLPDIYSTHAQLAAAHLDQGVIGAAMDHATASRISGTEPGDVHAEIAYHFAMIGEGASASRLLATAADLQREGRWDLSASTLTTLTRALLQLPSNPVEALEELAGLPAVFPLNLGIYDQRFALATVSHMISGDTTAAADSAREGLSTVRRAGHRRAEASLNILVSLLAGDPGGVRKAIAEAEHISKLALLEVADAVGEYLHVVSPVPDEMLQSISDWPARWLPVLRRQLDRGNDPRAHSAARLLAVYGQFEDVGRLRAFDKTYRPRVGSAGLGRALARRVSPRLEIHDLGQVSLTIGDRVVELSRSRRKPAALLMYLVTRPNHTATREQIIEDLWPDGDAGAGLNSLNQSLYFIRREIDPWYEDDLSPEYVLHQAELVSLDPSLVWIESADFLRRSREAMVGQYLMEEARRLLDMYHGQFAPEFEYEEWAITWRARVHAAYLGFARTAILRMAELPEFRAACDVALSVLAVDPHADDIERSLIWLYWHSGARSAAEAQHANLVAREKADGLDPTPLAQVVSGSLPA